MRCINFGTMLGAFILCTGLLGATLHGIFNLSMEISVPIGMVLSVLFLYFGYIRPRRV